jgi:5'(3')-deoxyribonucleotidase
MRFYELNEDGRIVKGVNTTVDVGPNEIPKQAKKFGNSVDKDGRPPTLSKKVKGKSTNVLFNLGLAEGYKLKLERDENIDVLHIVDTKTKKRIEVRGKKNYETNYDPKDKLHQVLDRVGKAANISELMNGEVVGINPKHPKGADAEKTAKDILTTESLDNIYESVLYYRQMKENLGEIAEATEIYIDMDGVLADFFGEWAKLMDKDHWTKINDFPDALQKIRDTEKFWLDLPILPQAKQLLALIKQVKGEYNICSTPLADDPKSEPHKREWIKKNLAFFPPKNIHITHNKPQYATQSDGTPNILIDDYGKNVNEWESAGGIGFKYKDHKFERTAKEIKKHMNEGAEITMWTNPEYQGADVDDKYYEKQPVKIVDISKLTPFEPADKMNPKDNHDNMMKFVDKIIAGKKIKPIVIVPYKGKGLIVDGHHRYFAHIKAGVDKIPAVIADPKDLTWRDDVPESVQENFADGKKKGKSRPGRVKRSGASCKGSVTSLRKRAKNASGEKAKMYHWCANMKSGKKKGK